MSIRILFTIPLPCSPRGIIFFLHGFPLSPLNYIKILYEESPSLIMPMGGSHTLYHGANTLFTSLLALFTSQLLGQKDELALCRPPSSAVIQE